jgi:hypothetical protein
MSLTSLSFHQSMEMLDFIVYYQHEVGHVENWEIQIHQDTLRDFTENYQAGETPNEYTRGMRQGLRDAFEECNLEMVPSQKIELERRFRERFGLEIGDLYPRWRTHGP